jgi:kinesin family protein 5
LSVSPKLLSYTRTLTSLHVRFRPVNAIEQREGGDIVVSFAENLQTVNVKSAQTMSGPEKDGFTFDRVFPMETMQHEVFDYGVKE